MSEEQKTTPRENRTNRISSQESVFLHYNTFKAERTSCMDCVTRLNPISRNLCDLCNHYADRTNNPTSSSTTWNHQQSTWDMIMHDALWFNPNFLLHCYCWRLPLLLQQQHPLLWPIVLATRPPWPFGFVFPTCPIWVVCHVSNPNWFF